VPPRSAIGEVPEVPEAPEVSEVPEVRNVPEVRHEHPQPDRGPLHIEHMFDTVDSSPARTADPRPSKWDSDPARAADAMQGVEGLRERDERGISGSEDGR
jgi:hypothetical protein